MIRRQHKHNLQEGYIDPFNPEGKQYLRRDKNDFVNMKMVSNDANKSRVYTDGKSVYAYKTFMPGDIVEICPCKVFSDQSLYSRELRDLVFEIAYNKFAMPFGYATIYDLANDPLLANCDYLWDANTECVIIKATKRINKGDKLWLNNVVS